MDRTKLARAAHEINRAYCAALGDMTTPSWEDAEQSQRDSILAGVDMHLANPDTTPEESHTAWFIAKQADGWVYAEVKDAAAKQHPCMVPYDELPRTQRVKDYLFSAVVRTLKDEPEAPAKVAAPVVVDSAFVSVKYIGKRETYTDGAYGSHIQFVRGESRPVPAAIAAKLLKHTDVYEPGDAVEMPASLPVAKAKNFEEDDNQDMRDAISRMDKDALISHAKTHYNVTLGKNNSVDTLRSKVTGLFDQYGVK
jgi:hypothetical protein